MTIASTEDTVDAFWIWFRETGCQLANDFENSALLEELDEQVSKLGQFGWELGPGTNKANALVLSPDGDPELLKLTRSIIAQAPELKDWEFHHAKPPKQWDLKLSLQGSEGEPVWVDARKWRYALLKFPDDLFDIVIVAPDLSSHDESVQYAAACVVLDGVLGEERRLERIANIEVLVEAPPDLESKLSSIADLDDHMTNL